MSARAQLAVVKPKTHAERQTRTVVDTIVVTPEILATWHSPPFQRPVRENDKVRALAEQLKHDGGVWPGIVTLGLLGGTTYIVDGQHRRAAFLISQLKEGFTDVRVHHFETMADMGDEFVLLNSQLVRMRPDDILRGLEESMPALQEIRSRCPFVGYDMVRRCPSAPLVSLSSAVRSWKAGSMEIPQLPGVSATELGRTLLDDEAAWMCDFLILAHEGFGRENEYARLWGSLNLIMSMWLYRRLVLTQYSQKSPRLSKDLFKKCLMSLSADTMYVDWLLGRKMGERDRAPAYNRIKGLFAKRLEVELHKKVTLPAPAWAHGSGAHKA